MLNREQMKTMLVRAQPVVFLLFLLAAWEWLPVVLDVPAYIFPRLTDVIAALWSARATVASNLQTTFLEATAGFVLGSWVGFVVGLLMAESRTTARTLLPYVVASNAVPIVAIAPLVAIWFGHGLLSKVVLAAFLCFFPLCINTYRGLAEFKPIYAELFSVYGASKLEFLHRFKLRNALPYLFSGLKLNATFSVIGAVVAEFVGSSSGLGYGMLQASYSLNTPRLFGYLIVSCGLGISMYGLTHLGEALASRRR